MKRANLHVPMFTHTGKRRKKSGKKILHPSGRDKNQGGCLASLLTSTSVSPDKTIRTFTAVPDPEAVDTQPSLKLIWPPKKLVVHTIRTIYTQSPWNAKTGVWQRSIFGHDHTPAQLHCKIITGVGKHSRNGSQPSPYILAPETLGGMLRSTHHKAQSWGGGGGSVSGGWIGTRLANAFQC